jgi:serine protease Do
MSYCWKESCKLIASCLCVVVAALFCPDLSAAQVTFSLQELQEVQFKVQAQLPKVRTAVIALDSSSGAASGVIISPSGLALTAAHVVHGMLKKGPGDGLVQVTLDDGKQVTAKLLGYDMQTDAGMIQLLGHRKDWPHVQLGRSIEALRLGDWCFALGHPGGRDEARGAVLRVGKTIKISTNSIQTDCVLMGGDSGGPLFNLRGEVVGIHSQIWESRDQNAHVSVAPFLRYWKDMQASKVISKEQSEQSGWLGVATEKRAQGGLRIEQVADLSPAASIGLTDGDVILQAQGQELNSTDDLSRIIACYGVGQSLNLLIQSSKQNTQRTLSVTLGLRPAY